MRSPEATGGALIPGSLGIPLEMVPAFTRWFLPYDLDVRRESEFRAGHLPYAQHLYVGELPNHLDRIPYDCEDKSTLLSCVNRLIEPTSEEVQIGGRSRSRCKTPRRYTGACTRNKFLRATGGSSSSSGDHGGPPGHPLERGVPKEEEGSFPGLEDFNPETPH